jgi:membrane-bound lytic murein transglycosylase D
MLLKMNGQTITNKFQVLYTTLIISVLTITVFAQENPQLPDSVLQKTAESMVTAEPDSLTERGLEMINDAGVAEKILNESTAVMMLDSLSNVPYFTGYLFTTDTSVLNIYNFPLGQIPEYDDKTYQERLEKLNRETPIEITYNKTVRSYIDLYAVKKRELTSKILGLKEIYFPLFEEYLDKYDMPMELKYLAVVESALNPTAGSRMGAKGLWQFMYYTGKLYGLKVSSLIDERYDPYLATDAACRHMKDLYNIFGDWSLVMAAYNSGAGNVNKAIRRAGGTKNYWAVWPFLPRETRGYVPAFIAVMYVMNYAPEHNLYPLHPGILYNGIDTVQISQPLSFDQVSEMLGIPMEDLKFLNPIYKTNLIPAYNGKVYSLRLPNEYINDFVDNEEALYQYKSKSGLEKEKILAEIKKASERTVHIVRRGENLGLIARKYGTSVSRLKSWNGLRGSTIYPGQRLIVYPSHSYTYVPTNTSPTSTSNKPKNPGYHIVKYGENLGLIANKYGCTISQLKRWNNLTSNTIHPNQKLIVEAGKTATTSGSPSYHTVKYGENLGLIAKKYGCSVNQLKVWNNLKNNTIHPNQKLIVSITSDTSGSEKIIYYTVKKGDTLWDIAQQYRGVSVKDIQQLNNLTNSSKLRVGQKLKIAVKG